MTEKNKMYLTPEIKVVEMKQESVICTSGTIDELENGGTVDWFDE